MVIGCRGEIVARHPRCWEREDVIFDPVHYLPLIEQKINSLDQAAPLQGWDLLEEFATLRRLMEGRMAKHGRREYVQVLRLLESFDLADLHAAVKQALQLGAIGFDAVKHLILCRVERRPPLDWTCLSIPTCRRRWLRRHRRRRTCASCHRMREKRHEYRSTRDPACPLSQDA